MRNQAHAVYQDAILVHVFNAGGGKSAATQVRLGAHRDVVTGGHDVTSSESTSTVRRAHLAEASGHLHEDRDHVSIARSQRDIVYPRHDPTCNQVEALLAHGV